MLFWQTIEGEMNTIHCPHPLSAQSSCQQGLLIWGFCFSSFRLYSATTGNSLETVWELWGRTQQMGQQIKTQMVLTDSSLSTGSLLYPQTRQVPPPAFTGQLRSDRRNCLCSRCWSPLDCCSLPSNLSCCPGERLDHPCYNLSLYWACWQAHVATALAARSCGCRKAPWKPPHTARATEPPTLRGKHTGLQERPTRLNHSWHLWIISSHQKSGFIPI